MITDSTLLNTTTSDYAFDPSTDLDFTSLFEQCGIPIADLSSELESCSPAHTKESAKKWNHGSGPLCDDIVELEDNQSKDSTCSNTSEHSLAQGASKTHGNEAESSIDGFGSDTVSHLRGPRSALTNGTVSATNDWQSGQHLRCSPMRSTTPCRQAGVPTSPRPVCTAIKNGSVPFDSATKPLVTSPSPLRAPTKNTATTQVPNPRTQGKHISMDFYAQQQYYQSAQLSSPISMQSVPDEDSLLYSSAFSPPFGAYAWQNPHLSALTEPESMRRSISTPFLGERSANIYANFDNYDYAFNPDTSVLEAAEVVPASTHSAWAPAQFWSPTTSNTAHVTEPRLSINAIRPSMQRKHRPMPISTTMPRSSAMAGPHTAPINRRMFTPSVERPQLSAKRSFEDFSNMNSNDVAVPPYRHIATPISKRSKSSQGLDCALPVSPFIDEPLFSPEYHNGLSLPMASEQFLLSPPYSQTDFCSSPSYIARGSQEHLHGYLLPDNINRQDLSYNSHQALNTMDIEGLWAQQTPLSCTMSSTTTPSTPRNLNFDTSSPMRKTPSKLRRVSTARAISFCNYTAADKKTILSGVAPSGSNKKIVSKPQEMSRSRSSAAIAV